MKTCLVQAATGANIYLGLGSEPARFGGILFRVAGTNPVVLISYD